MFIRVYQNFHNSPQNTNAEAFCTQVFDAFDLDQNGSIDFLEFIIGLSYASSNDVTKRLKLAFKIYDLDKNGKITKSEMEKVIIAIYKMAGIKRFSGENNPKKLVQNMFQKMDLNNDGVLTEKEFIESKLFKPYRDVELLLLKLKIIIGSFETS